MSDKVLQWVKDDEFSLHMLLDVLAAATRYQYVVNLPDNVSNLMFYIASN